MDIKTLPDVETLRQLFIYNAETGDLIWRERPASFFPDARSHKSWTTQFCGKIAGCITAVKDGKIYRDVHYKKQRWRAHRVVWKMHYGTDPPELIDHKDGDGTNNRLENLRTADICQNGWNVKKSSRNKSGYKGVSFSVEKKRWRAAIRVMRKDILIGHYNSPEEASAAYQKAAAAYHGEFYKQT